MASGISGESFTRDCKRSVLAFPSGPACQLKTGPGLDLQTREFITLSFALGRVEL